MALSPDEADLIIGQISRVYFDLDTVIEGLIALGHEGDSSPPVVRKLLHINAAGVLVNSIQLRLGAEIRDVDSETLSEEGG